MASAKEKKTRRSRNDFIKHFDQENHEIAERLREVREDAGKTQQYMADKIEVSRTYIISIEQGSVRIPAFIVKEYCDVLDMPAERILGTDYSMITTNSGRAIRDLLPHIPERLADALLELIHAADH